MKPVEKFARELDAWMQEGTGWSMIDEDGEETETFKEFVRRLTAFRDEAVEEAIERFKAETLAPVLARECNFGELLEATGLEIVSKTAPTQPPAPESGEASGNIIAEWAVSQGFGQFCLDHQTVMSNLNEWLKRRALLARFPRAEGWIKDRFAEGRMKYCSHTEDCSIWAGSAESVVCNCGYDEWLADLLPDPPKEDE